MADQSHQLHYQNQLQNLQRKGQEAVTNFKNFLQQNSPSTPHLIALFIVVPVGAFLLFLSGLSFMSSLIGLVVATPVFIFFSPVIVPAALGVGLAVIGFWLSGAFGITGLSALSWIINFIRYRTGGLEHVMERAGETVGQMGQKVKEMGQDVGGSPGRGREVGRT
ncbi:oleosin H2-like [Silene latifolia]|uniref:oleosin H2-like n=1 Tax=Silene latifolia TaxID=37657 RepID=UPI003D786150